MNKQTILDVALSLADIAESIGDTNDKKKYAENMADEIYEAFKLIHKNH